MYEELTEKFVKTGADQDLVEKIFSMKKYNRPGFPEYVLNRMDRANPANIDQWLKLSVRYCLKSFINNGKQPSVSARRNVNKRRSETMLKKKELKEETDNAEQMKKDYDSLNKTEKDQYYQRVKKVNSEVPGFLIKLRAFLLYCNDKEGSA